MSRGKGEEPSWDPIMEPLIKLLMSKKGVRIGEAAEIGKRKVSYFRGKDFMKLFEKQEALVVKKCKKALDKFCDGKAPSTPEHAVQLGQQLIMSRMIFPAVYKPVGGDNADGSGKTKKWPDRLQRAPRPFNADGYYIIDYEGSQTGRTILVALLVIGILLMCMFKVWPMWAKLGAWYLLVVFLSMVFVLLIVRLVAFMCFWILGYDFWIFPNLLDEDLGVVESFIPSYSWDKRSDGVTALMIRIAALSVAAFGMYNIGQTHSLADLYEFTQSNLMDIVTWGEDQLLALPTSNVGALPSLEDIERETATNETDEDDDKLDDDTVDDKEKVADKDAEKDKADL
mmetsp:Transcript_110988/g.254395  ORF Transcript_110988/g.254395 Transcript_110988/m.254395 type:complete len:341 (-) Transcript_110988:120-1142(-)